MKHALAVLALFAAAAVAPAPVRADRPDTPGSTELFRFAAGDVVETYAPAGSAFAIHYTRMGINAVPAADGDASGVPDHVERLAEIYDEVLAFYRDELGYRVPLSDATIIDNGGDERFDVYLVDFAGRADGTFRIDACGVGGAPDLHCVGFMVQENDFAGYGYPSIEYANRVLASHELFHAIQSAYDTYENSVIREGTAVWATEAFDPSLRDLEGFAHGYLENTERPIDSPLPGPVDPFSYGAGLVFQFFSERFDRDLIRTLWEDAETAADWLGALVALLERDHATTFAETFPEFVQWNLFTADRADPSRSYAGGAGYPRVTTVPITLPHTGMSLRIFPASARYYAADPSPRTSVRAELVGDAPDVQLLVATRLGSAITIAPDPSAVDVTSAVEIIVVVLSTATTGESMRPSLCVGDDAEVAACRASLTPSPDAGPVPGSDAGPPGADAGSDTPPGDGDDGCGCRAPGTSRSMPGGAIAAMLALAAVTIRARRRRA